MRKFHGMKNSREKIQNFQILHEKEFDIQNIYAAKDLTLEIVDYPANSLNERMETTVVF